jgi:hypothetical protein
MAWYTDHHLRYRGRLVKVGSRYGSFNGARVVKGKPLDLSEGSRDEWRVRKMFYRSERIQCEIRSFVDALSEMD